MSNLPYLAWSFYPEGHAVDSVCVCLSVCLSEKGDCGSLLWVTADHSRIICHMSGNRAEGCQGPQPYVILQHIVTCLGLSSLHLSPPQDENMVSFIKGGIKVRNSYQTYK